jgi:hypothetical protein
MLQALMEAQASPKAATALIKASRVETKRHLAKR